MKKRKLEEKLVEEIDKTTPDIFDKLDISKMEIDPPLEPVKEKAPVWPILRPVLTGSLSFILVVGLVIMVTALGVSKKSAAKNISNVPGTTDSTDPSSGTETSSLEKLEANSSSGKVANLILSGTRFALEETKRETDQSKPIEYDTKKDAIKGWVENEIMVDLNFYYRFFEKSANVDLYLKESTEYEVYIVDENKNPIIAYNVTGEDEVSKELEGIFFKDNQEVLFAAGINKDGSFDIKTDDILIQVTYDENHNQVIKYVYKEEEITYIQKEDGNLYINVNNEVEYNLKKDDKGNLSSNLLITSQEVTKDRTSVLVEGVIEIEKTDSGYKYTFNGKTEYQEGKAIKEVVTYEKVLK